MWKSLGKALLRQEAVVEWYIKSDYTPLSDVYEKVIYSALCMLGVVNVALLGIILFVATSITNFMALSLLILYTRINIFLCVSLPYAISVGKLWQFRNKLLFYSKPSPFFSFLTHATYCLRHSFKFLLQLYGMF